MYDEILDKMMKFFMVILLGFFLAFNIYGRIRTISENKTLNRYCDNNYTFIYKQRKLSKEATKDLLAKVKHEKNQLTNKKKTKEYKGYVYSVNERKYLIFIAHKKEKTVLIFNVKKGSADYMTLQCVSQLGFKILHNEKVCSKKETKELLNHVEKNNDCILTYDDKKKTAEIID